MDCIIIKCKDCGTIMVINTKELWKLTNCNKCNSKNISTLDEEFDYMEVIDVEQSKKD